MSSLVVRRLAWADLRDAQRWYERHRQGLGAEYFHYVDHVMRRIGASPFQFPEIRPGVRRALVPRFPYSIYFVVGEDGVPTVIAVLHQHLDSDTLARRMKP